MNALPKPAGRVVWLLLATGSEVDQSEVDQSKPRGCMTLLGRWVIDICLAQEQNLAPVLEGYPSGQRDQTVNLTAQPSKVRILPPPPSQDAKPIVREVCRPFLAARKVQSAESAQRLSVSL